MLDDRRQEKGVARVTVRLPWPIYRALNTVAQRQQITLSKCIRDRISDTLMDAIKMPAIQKASLQIMAELLYYGRSEVGSNNPALISEAKQHAEHFVKKMLEDKQ